MTHSRAAARPRPNAARHHRSGVQKDGALGIREPSLSELLDDPITRQVMASDRIDVGDLSTLIARIRHHLADRGLADAIIVRAHRP